MSPTTQADLAEEAANARGENDLFKTMQPWL